MVRENPFLKNSSKKIIRNEVLKDEADCMKINSISETTYNHISGSDGLPLAVLRIEPENPEDIKGIVQMVHGKNEHKGRYVSIYEVSCLQWLFNDNK